MNNLRISLDTVNECAGKIRMCSAQMYEHLQEMKKEMNSTGNTWISEGGEAIRTRFNQFAGRFDLQKELIESYASFLDRTVETYNTLETTITGNASSVQV